MHSFSFFTIKPLHYAALSLFIIYSNLKELMEATQSAPPKREIKHTQSDCSPCLMLFHLEQLTFFCSVFS